MGYKLSEIAVALRAEGVDLTVAQIGRVERQLGGLRRAADEAGRGTAAAGAKVADATKGMGKNSELVQSLIYSFNGLAASAVGIPQSFGTLTAALLPMAVGGTVTALVLAGITVLGRAYEALGGSARKAAKEAKEAAEEFKRSLDTMQNTGDVAGLTAQAKALYEGSASQGFTDGIKALRAQLAERQRDLDAFSKTQGPLFVRRLEREIAALEAKLAPLETRLQDVQRRILAPGPSLTRTVQPIVTTAAAPRTERQASRDAARAAAAAREEAEGRAADALTAFERRARADLDAQVVAGFRMKGGGLFGQVPEAIMAGLPKTITLPKPSIDTQHWLEAFTDVKAETDRLFANLTAGIADVFVDGLSTAFAEGFGNAGRVVLRGLGSIMSQMGAALVKQGAILVGLLPALTNPLTSGPAMLAAGAALLALGGILGGIATGRGGPGGPGGGAVATAAGGASVSRDDDALRYTIGQTQGAGAAGAAPSAAARAVAPVHVTHVSLGTLTPTQEREFADMYNRAAQRGLIR